MSNKCAGCLNKFKFREKPKRCPDCQRSFCSICLPGIKGSSKTAAETRTTCVYCSKQQRELTKQEEIQVKENFLDRFYRNPHKIKYSPANVPERKTPVSEGQKLPAAINVSPDVMLLEERFRKLKDNPSQLDSTVEIEGKLAKLRGEEDGEKPTADNPPAPQDSKGTQFEEAQKLLEQESERAKLDEKLADASRIEEEDLEARFLALKGKPASSSTNTATVKLPTVDAEQLLKDMEDDTNGDDDFEKLLEDLGNVQQEEESAALRAADEIQDIVSKKPKVDKDEASPLPSCETGEGSKTKDVDEEVKKLILATSEDVKHDQEVQEADSAFIKSCKEQLGDKNCSSHEDEESDCVVRSKNRHSLSFSWNHFESDGKATACSNSSPADLALQRIGLAFGDFKEDDCIDEEVDRLMEQVLSEATLDSKLDSEGLLDDTERRTAAVGGGGGGASAYNPPVSDGEFPWCCICNEDATIRCFDCDNDLYCTRCFSEGHEQFGLFDHHYAPYEPPGPTRMQTT